MEKCHKVKETALKHIKAADYMFSVTFPMVKDTKLLLAIVDNIFLSYTNIMTALLEYERLQKRVPPFQESYESKLTMFKLKCVRLHNVPEKYVNTMQEIKDILEQHEKSPIEFIRKDRFVICSDNYAMKSITTETIQGYIAIAKQFYSFVDDIMQS